MAMSSAPGRDLSLCCSMFLCLSHLQPCGLPCSPLPVPRSSGCAHRLFSGDQPLPRLLPEQAPAAPGGLSAFLCTHLPGHGPRRVCCCPARAVVTTAIPAPLWFLWPQCAALLPSNSLCAGPASELASADSLADCDRGCGQPGNGQLSAALSEGRLLLCAAGPGRTASPRHPAPSLSGLPAPQPRRTRASHGALSWAVSVDGGWLCLPLPHDSCQHCNARGQPQGCADMGACSGLLCEGRRTGHTAPGAGQEQDGGVRVSAGGVG